MTLKWLTQQTASTVPGNLARVKDLMSHPAFNMSNPNSCYSLFGGFFQSPVTFHAANGSGYEFLGDAILKVIASFTSSMPIQSPEPNLAMI